MLEYVTYARTVTELPVGTRVAKAKGDDLLGTVTGTRSNSVGVRWDNGGTSYGPASHGLWIVAEDEAGGGQSAKTSMEERPMTSILKPLLPLDETPGFADAFAKAVADTRNTVCEVCGLGNMGHAPESEWLGFEPHRYAPVRADRAMLERATELTSEAYRRRRSESGIFA